MADVLVGVILVELLLLAWLAPQRLPAAAPGLCAGLGLALALRCALTDAAWHWLVLSLLAAGTAHVVEMQRHWRR